ncbi:MAG: helix-turn-helix domain-containing protein [Planctomycetia bacterium]|nr:helix-turn-helix domain-containing protein [Planctomycetia bacterium]
MSTSVAAVVNEALPPAWQQDFLAHLLPRVKTHARFGFRSLPRCEREEAEADAVAVAMVFFVRLVNRGKNASDLAPRIAQIAVLRVKAGRIIGTGERRNDVLSRVARQRRGFQVESLDSGTSADQKGWQSVLVEDRKSTPADIAASRIDFSAWLNGMTHRRRQIAESLAAGYRTEEVAEKFHVSRSRISQLRREFEDSWREFQRDARATHTGAAA